MQATDLAELIINLCKSDAPDNHAVIDRRDEEHAVRRDKVIARMLGDRRVEFLRGHGPFVVPTCDVIKVGAQRLLSHRGFRSDGLDRDTEVLSCVNVHTVHASAEATRGSAEVPRRSSRRFQHGVRAADCSVSRTAACPDVQRRASELLSHVHVISTRCRDRFPAKDFLVPQALVEPAESGGPTRRYPSLRWRP